MNSVKMVLLMSAFSIATAQASEKNRLFASLADSAWDGVKIPDGQQCAKFSGKGESPRIRVNNIPPRTDAIVVEFSDETYEPMRDGGHGKVGYYVDKRMTEVTVPPIKGHTFDLPESFFVVEPQRAPQWDTAGAYLPPCSGGKGNTYAATIKAVRLMNGRVVETMADTNLILGKY